MNNNPCPIHKKSCLDCRFEKGRACNYGKRNLGGDPIDLLPDGIMILPGSAEIENEPGGHGEGEL